MGKVACFQCYVVVGGLFSHAIGSEKLCFCGISALLVSSMFV